jgi:hypothetical protein
MVCEVSYRAPILSATRRAFAIIDGETCGGEVQIDGAVKLAVAADN